ncbi:hypothetical protein TVAG_110740 [Trichomonas vaginalis G3]|uniref:Uncharacterized protein n=1 Tax=Trichomonas vaginalis (strain ATCC PRA-98 / G3) TaxID=412133 RepID=A2DGS4_TRIV3|nr:transmembrane protein 181 family [Trichomonas vaginalis G3]EAY20461.1 hypothetical protein TVAG_110740 [Trichomonas vaginalis G3]KAI5490489.1 transmembrane protein 181 family [Trichomonas vaginalis G3]|eukprot:XP_001581447.1 hypothetical protein [Trichomonas vaginalis G3]
MKEGMDWDLKQLKPVENTPAEENSAIVADAWKSKQVTHVLICFLITAIVLISISFVGPPSSIKSSSTSKLPVYAGSGPFDMKLAVTKVSPFNQKISVFVRFLTSEAMYDYAKPFVNSGKMLFTPKVQNKSLPTRIMKFSNLTFDIYSRKYVELFEENMIYFDEFDLVTSFEKGCESCVEMEYATVYTSVSSTFYDIWTRLAFTIALSIILFRSSTYNFISTLPYKTNTYLLLFIVILANNPLHILSFSFLSQYFYLYDKIIEIVEQSFIIYYSLWIIQTLTDSQISASFFGMISISILGFNLYNNYYPEIVIGSGNTITPEMELGLYTGAILLVGLVLSFFITTDLPDLQERSRRLVYFATIFITRIPFYLAIFVPKKFLPNQTSLVLKYLSNNLFAALMLFINLKLPWKALNSYVDPSEQPDGIEELQPQELAA